MSIEIRLKRGTASYLEQLNPVLLAGEPCLETDTTRVKYGDGTTPWRQLPYSNSTGTDQTIFSGLTTTSAPIFLSTDDPILLNVDELLHFNVVVTAFQQSRQSPRATWRISGSAHRRNDGSVVFIGTPTTTISGNPSGATVAVVVGSNAALNIRAVGVENKTINWYAAATVSRFAVSPAIYVPVGGCTDPDATNYNVNADFDNGSCTYSGAPSTAALKPITSNNPITSIAVTVGSNSLYPVFNSSIKDYCVSTSSAYLGSVSYSVTINNGTPITGTAKAGRTLQINDGTDYYYVRLLPSDVIVGDVQYGPTENYVPGYYLAGRAVPGGSNSRYFYIYDHNGVPVWYGLGTISDPLSVHVGSGFNRVCLSYQNGVPRITGKFNAASLTTASYPALTSPTYGNVTWDHHDMLELRLPATRTGNIVAIGHVSAGGFYLQEQSSSGDLVWEWNSTEYFTAADPEYFHANSVSVNPVTGNMLVSCRNSSAVLCIDYATKNVLWVLQGPPSSSYGTLQAVAKSATTANTKWLTISGEPTVDGFQYSGTRGQHDAKWLPDSFASVSGNRVISIFDDQSESVLGFTSSGAGPYARGVVYEINEQAGTATHVSSIFSETGTSPFMGNYEIVDANGVLSHAITFPTHNPELVEYIGNFNEEKTKVFAMDVANDPYRIIKVPPSQFRLDNLRATCGVNVDTGALPSGGDGGGGGGSVTPVAELLMHFDGPNNSTTFTDSSGKNRTVTANGNAKISTAQSKFGGASGYFDGDPTTYGRINSFPDFDGAGDFTIEMWIYVNDNTTYQSLLGCADVENGHFFLAINPSGDNTDTIGLAKHNVVFYSANAPAGLQAQTWQHIACVRTGNNLLFFVNGVQIGDPVSVSGAFPITTAIIGNHGVNSSNVGIVPFNGYIDDLRIVKSAAYTSNFPPPRSPFSDPVPAPAPALLMHFDGSNGATTFTDSSGSNLTVTANGNAAISTAQSKFGGASGYFDGDSSTYARIESFPSFDGTGDFTVDMWIYPTSVSGWQTMLGAPLNDVDALQFSLNHLNPGTLALAQAYANVYAGGPSGIEVNNWYHVAATRAGNTLRLFVNGVQINDNTDVTEQQFLINTLLIGAVGENPSAASFTGYIDELRIVNGVAVWTGNFIPPTTPYGASNTLPDPALLMHFDGSDGTTTFIDSSPNALTVTANGNAAISTAQSKFGGASGYFDGNSSVDVAYSSALAIATGNFSIEMWLRPSASGSTAWLLGATANINGYLMLAIIENQLGLTYGIGLGGASAGWPVLIECDPLPVDTWTHLALTRSGSDNRLFINGVQIGSTVTDATPWPISPGGLRVGHTDGGSGFNGYIDELRIFKNVAVYTANFTPPTAPFGPTTQLLLHFDGSDGSTAIIDSSSYARAASAGGNAQISTTQSKFGGASVYFDGDNSSLVAVDSTGLSIAADEDFTIEMWVNYADPSGYHYLFAPASANNSNVGGGLMQFAFLGAFPNPNSIGFGRAWVDWPCVWAPHNVTADTWHHIALCRSSGVVRCFVDGVQLGSGIAFSDAFLVGSNGLHIGHSDQDGTATGYIDEFRWVKGFAVYTDDFTPPAAPFTA